jgi:hexulose-6-phosphate isomerase
MKKAISIWSFAGGSLKENIKTAYDAGYEGIELSLDESGDICPESRDEDILAIKKYADDTGIRIHSLATGLYWSYSLTSSDKTIREKAMHIFKRQLEIAHVIGADAILVIPGYVGVDFIPGCEVVPYDVAYDMALEAVCSMKNLAEELNVDIGIENVWNKFLLSPLEMRDFIDKTDSKRVGAYFDVGNVIYSGYPEHWIKILGSRIKKVHFKDYRSEAGGLYGFVDLLSGDVNWPVVVNELDKAGYTGYVTAEMLPPYKHHPEQIIFNTLESMKKILGG